MAEKTGSRKIPVTKLQRKTIYLITAFMGGPVGAYETLEEAMATVEIAQRAGGWAMQIQEVTLYVKT